MAFDLQMVDHLLSDVAMLFPYGWQEVKANDVV
jgi:hypothetical protein